MNNDFDSPQARAVFQQVVSQQMHAQRDLELAAQHRRDWAAQKKAVFVDAPTPLRQAVLTKQRAIEARATALEELASLAYRDAMAEVKHRYRADDLMTRAEREIIERDLLAQWNERRAEIRAAFVYRLADQYLASAQADAYAAAQAAAEAVWDRQGEALLERYVMPPDPAWASKPDQAPAEKKPTRRRPATAAR